MSTVPAIEAQQLLADERWLTYRDRLRKRLAQCQERIVQDGKDHPQMCRLAGEIRGLRYALGLPDEMAKSDPRSDP